jgi:hypothetical protein
MTALKEFSEVYPAHRSLEVHNAIQAGSLFIKSIQREVTLSDIHIYTYIYAYIYIYMYVYIYVHIYVYICRMVAGMVPGGVVSHMEHGSV